MAFHTPICRQGTGWSLSFVTESLTPPPGAGDWPVRTAPFRGGWSLRQVAHKRSFVCVCEHQGSGDIILTWRLVWIPSNLTQWSHEIILFIWEQKTEFICATEGTTWWTVLNLLIGPVQRGPVLISRANLLQCHLSLGHLSS